MRDKENQRKWAIKRYHERKNDPVYRAQRLAAGRRYWHAHKKEYALARVKYFESHKDYYRKYRREWRYNNPKGIYSVIKDGLNSKKQPRKVLLKISRDDFVEWYSNEEKICFYCKRTFEQSQTDALNRKVHRLTIDRIDNSRGYENGNLALACLRCNAIKNNYFTQDEMLKIGQIIHDKDAR